MPAAESNKIFARAQAMLVETLLGCLRCLPAGMPRWDLLTHLALKMMSGSWIQHFEGDHFDTQKSQSHLQVKEFFSNFGTVTLARIPKARMFRRLCSLSFFGAVQSSGLGCSGGAWHRWS